MSEIKSDVGRLFEFLRTAELGDEYTINTPDSLEEWRSWLPGENDLDYRIKK